MPPVDRLSRNFEVAFRRRAWLRHLILSAGLPIGRGKGSLSGGTRLFWGMGPAKLSGIVRLCMVPVVAGN